MAGNLLDGSMIAHDPRSPDNHESTIISGAQRGGVNRTRNWVAFSLIGVAEPLSLAHRSCFFSFFFHSLSIAWLSSGLLSESVLGPRHTIAEGREIIAKSAGCCAQRYSLVLLLYQAISQRYCESKIQYSKIIKRKNRILSLQVVLSS